MNKTPAHSRSGCSEEPYRLSLALLCPARGSAMNNPFYLNMACQRQDFFPLAALVFVQEFPRCIPMKAAAAFYLLLDVPGSILKELTINSKGLFPAKVQ